MALSAQAGLLEDVLHRLEEPKQAAPAPPTPQDLAATPAGAFSCTMNNGKGSDIQHFTGPPLQHSPAFVVPAGSFAAAESPSGFSATSFLDTSDLPPQDLVLSLLVVP